MNDPEPVDEQCTEIRGGNRLSDYVQENTLIVGPDDEFEEDGDPDWDDHDKANR